MLKIDDTEFNNRLLLGTSAYPSLDSLKESINSSGAEIVTVSLRRSEKLESDLSPNSFWETLKSLPVKILPNTAGCHTVKEAVTTAQMAREIFETSWIKLEVTGDDYNLQPDPFQLVEAARILNEQGFKVFPYMTDDLVLAEKLVEVGCDILMPWASPIGSGQGLLNPYALKVLRNRFKELILIVDAGIGTPSDAAKAMELGYDACLLNTAVAKSGHPSQMAMAFSKAIEAGNLAYQAGAMVKREMAQASTPIVGTPFWHGENYDSSSSKHN
ncbi:MAG: thiazole synthase [Bacteriovoracaceae bacterium]